MCEHGLPRRPSGRWAKGAAFPGWLLVGLTTLPLGACGTGDLRVRFVIAAGYAGETASVTLQIYEPNDANLVCDDVAFGRTALAPVQQLRVDAGKEIHLSGIARQGRKLLVAEAYDVGAVRLAAGCAVVGNIDRNVHVDIMGEAAKLLQLDDEDALDPLTGQIHFGGSATLLVTDARGLPLEGAEVWWTLHGGAKSQQAHGPQPANATGHLAVALTGDLNPGPFLLEAQARWLNAALRPLTGFVPPAITSFDLGDFASAAGVVGGVQLGSMGPNGEPGLTMLLRAGTVTRGAAVWFDSTGSIVTPAALSPPLTAAGAAPVHLPIRSSGATDDIIVVSRPDAMTPSLYAVILQTDGTALSSAGQGNIPIQDPSGVGAGPYMPNRLLPAEDCSQTASAEVIIQLVEQRPPADPIEPIWTALTIDRGLTLLPQARLATLSTGPAHFVASGCLDFAPPAERARVGVVQFGSESDWFILGTVDRSARLLQANWSGGGGHFAFTSPLQASTSRLLSLFRSGTRMALVSYGLPSISPTEGLVFQELGNLAAPPISYPPLGGDFDADGRLDVGFVTRLSSSQVVAVGLSFGTAEEEDAFVALFYEGLGELLNPNVAAFVVDVDADGKQDILLVEPQAGGLAMVHVLHMGVRP